MLTRLFVGVSFLIMAQGCGSPDSRHGGQSVNHDKASSMSGDLTELQTMHPAQSPALLAAYGYRPTTAVTGFFGMYTDQRYISGAIQMISSGVYRMEASAGFYSEDNGVLTTIAKKVTCPGLAPGGAIRRGSGDSIVATVGSTTTILSRMRDSTPPADGLVFQWGCFDRTTGDFTQHSWTDVP